MSLSTSRSWRGPAAGVVAFLVVTALNTFLVGTIPPRTRAFIVKPLPDPFTFENGTRVSSMADWAVRREEIKELLMEIEYGHLAPPPDAMNITVTRIIENYSDGFPPGQSCTRKDYNVSVVPDLSNRSKDFSFRMSLGIPSSGTPPFPTFVRVGYGFMPVPIQRGYAFCYYENLDFDEDGDAMDNPPPAWGPAQRAYPGLDWGSLMVWAWGLMRAVDVLETIPEVDASKLIATGHSRAGKVALIAAAFDERIAMAAPTHSGIGGAAAFLVQEPGSEKLGWTSRLAPYHEWYKTGFANRYGNGHEGELPFDQHFLKALIAPRHLVCVEARDYSWGNPEGNWATHLAAREVFGFLGVLSNIAITWRDGGHVYHDELENNAICDYADMTWFGASSEREFDAPPFPTSGIPGTFYSWSKPTLESKD